MGSTSTAAKLRMRFNTCFVKEYEVSVWRMHGAFANELSVAFGEGKKKKMACVHDFTVLVFS